MVKLGAFYPSDLHRHAAAEVLSFFEREAGVDAVLLVNSCARGSATKDSCLDIAVLANPEVHADRGVRLEKRWSDAKASCPIVGEFERSGKYTEIHAHVFDGAFREDAEEWDGGHDPFELEIGNTLAYSHPLWLANDRFEMLRTKWLPYYGDEMRRRRFERNEAFFVDHLDRVVSASRRGLKFHANRRLHWAFEKFLQNLFIARRVYPLSYDKWIAFQLEELLGLEGLAGELGRVFELSDFFGDSLEESAGLLRELYGTCVKLG